MACESIQSICPYCQRSFNLTYQQKHKRHRVHFCSMDCYKNSKSKDIKRRFWLRVKIGNPSECWEWIGSRRGYRYGSFCIDGKGYSASRIAWELSNGKIPDGMNVLHKCDNPPCCNPDHLFLGTVADNSEDMMNKGRHHKNEKKSHCVNGHEMTEANTALQEVSSKYGNYTQRTCMECRKLAARKYRANLKLRS